MFYFGGLFGVLTLGLWLFCLIDVITTADGDARNLPKGGWLLIVLFFPLVGSIVWLVAGRPVGAARRPGALERSAPAFPEYDRPGRFAATDSESDAEFLRRCRERAEEQRRKARETRDEAQ
ncbi:PLD nuclease N-terminal domain-containing protein [Actinosynnema sp. NPDC047251]|uniref:Putative secreted protein n=1 Tax=Saccharothrix espanaensis (strain ATCC 51144 / DSM 44229 / JCM 9112 / NBRC 15066 / NRRL 15764) TaxID=1179773 RepID=K0JY76_SACES|nr:PLD nuclease N-terminal domain-containing protein [Saccharothrix espanaensis]CCH29654.1 putative secreted protein [Saccharothrix espanaensis DSM 44229]